MRVTVIVVIAFPLGQIVAFFDMIIFNHDAKFMDFGYLLSVEVFQNLRWELMQYEAFTRYFVIASSGALILALMYGEEVKTYIIRNAELEQLRRESELRALRYQINPHFIFNALNSVSSLIIDNENEKAERLLDKFSDFMRSSLIDEPEPMMRVLEEIKLQERYLEIEKIRFPDRFSYEIDIAPELKNQLVPSLIVQPIIENAVKYGVARSRTKVTIRINVWRQAGSMHILVENDGDNDNIEMDGTNIGHDNIRQRLEAHYGTRAMLTVKSSTQNEYVAEIVIPMVDADRPTQA